MLKTSGHRLVCVVRTLMLRANVSGAPFLVNARVEAKGLNFVVAATRKATEIVVRATIAA
jgi:hypothetical protein